MSKKSRTAQSLPRQATRSEPRSITVGPRAAVAVLLCAALGFFVWGRMQQGAADTLMGVGDTPTGEPAAMQLLTAPAVNPSAAAAGGTPTWGVTADGDPFYGSPLAPVTVVEYADYQCPNCRQFATEVLPWLASTWLGQGLVRVVYRDFAIRGEASFRAAQAAHCAGDQGRYWPYHDALFLSQTDQSGEPFDRTQLLTLANEVALEPSAFAACLDDERYRNRVQAATDAALAKGFKGTPTYEINGRVTSGAIEIDRWNELFQAYENELGG